VLAHTITQVGADWGLFSFRAGLVWIERAAMSNLALLLGRVNRGEVGAYEELAPSVYEEPGRHVRACLTRQGSG
jgi:hypothetical protein